MLQNTNPIPVPPQNNIEYQLKLLYSGLLFSSPSLIFPYFDKLSQRRKKQRNATNKTYNQPKFKLTQFITIPETKFNVSL